MVKRISNLSGRTGAMTRTGSGSNDVDGETSSAPGSPGKLYGAWLIMAPILEPENGLIIDVSFAIGKSNHPSSCNMKPP